MAAKTTPESIKQIHYLAAALKAPRITETAQRLADQARDAGWTHEEFLVACSNARSPPATPPAARGGSAPPGSRPARPWRSSTSTHARGLNATRSLTSAPWTSSTEHATWC